MKTISSCHTRKVQLSGVEEGYAIIIEKEAYVSNGIRKWTKTITSLTEVELSRILDLVRKAK